MADGKRWTAQDKYGNSVYLTEERWQHIVNNHPLMRDCENHLKTTIARGRRHQDALDPSEYRYRYSFEDLPSRFKHLVAIVLCRFDVDEKGKTLSNHFVVTAYLTR